MLELLQGAGPFIYPLGVCSLLAVFISFERLFALRRSQIIPRYMREAFLAGRVPESEGYRSVAGQVLAFYEDAAVDAEQLKAFARLQVSRMERGLFLLDIVTATAPLLGLLGTVTGLVKVFSQISPETGLPDPGAFVQGVALALSTTMIGLAIAIPALAFGAYLNRKVDSYAAELGVGVERLIALKRVAEAR